MSCQDPKGIDDEGCCQTSIEDYRNQSVVLGHLLGVYPDRLTIPDLVRELVAGNEGFTKSDALACAVRDLIGVGLLRCSCELVEPTRAALRFHELSDG